MPLEFKAGASMSLVCSHCSHVVVRGDRDLVNLGRVADVTFGDSALAHGDSGTFQGKTFTVLGRVVMQHPQGGTWEEYYATFDGQAPSWIEEAMGRWFVLQQVAAFAPPITSLAPGAEVDLGPYGMFTVDEVSQGTFLSAEGELPFSASPGTVWHFADLSATDGARASLQQTDGSDAVEVYIGVETTFDGLGVFKRSGERAEHTIALKEIQCSSCGAPLPARRDPKAERFVCNYCGALADAATLAVVAKQDISRLAPRLRLGAEGMLEDVLWTVIGYVRRTTTIEDELFAWEEYLLYDKGRGYAWLALDEGVWRFGGAIAAGEVDVRDFPSAVRHGGKSLRLRNSGQATVSHVLGEFYWQVSVDETVLTHDFESGQTLVSREASGTEINWTRMKVVSASSVERAFGKNEPAKAAAADAPPPTPGFVGGPPQLSTLFPLFAALVFVAIVVNAKGGCSGGTNSTAYDDDSGYGTSRGGGGAGGFGGMGGK